MPSEENTPSGISDQESGEDSYSSGAGVVDESGEEQVSGSEEEEDNEQLENDGNES